MKEIGGNAHDLKMVAFKGLVDVITSLLRRALGPRNDPAGAAPRISSGQPRVVVAPRRLGEPLAGIPTWKEIGDFMTGAQFRKEREKDYADMKAVLSDLGLVEQ